MRLKEGITALMDKQNLNSQFCKQMMQDLLQPELHPFQKVAFLVLLRSKTETAEELLGMVNALQDHMIPVHTGKKTLDIVGTGGDGACTVNISTGSALLAAACGVVVAKHGNSAVTSMAGSADVLAALGVNLDMSAEKIGHGIDTLGIGFCFAPNFHPVLRELRTLRQDLNVPTSLNLLGPLLNPTRPKHLLVGVYHPQFMPIMAETLQKLGVQHALVVHGQGLDELSCLGIAQALEVKPDGIHALDLDPQRLGLDLCRLQDLQGGTAQENAALLKDALRGGSHRQSKVLANTFILNAAVAMYLYGVYPSIAQAIPLAQEKIADGSALALLGRFVAYSHE